MATDNQRFEGFPSACFLACLPERTIRPRVVLSCGYTLIDFHARLLDELRPFGNFKFDVLGKLLRRIGSRGIIRGALQPVSYTHLRAHETRHDLVCRLLLEKK